MSAPFVAGVLGPGAPELAAACARIAGAGLVVVAGGAAAGDGPATRRARRRAHELGAAGLPATAAGPIAWLGAGDAADALLAVRSAGTLAVLAVAGPRDGVAEELLEACAAVLVAASEDDEVVALVLDELAARAVRVTPPGAVERAALRAGLPPARARRRALREVLGA